MYMCTYPYMRIFIQENTSNTTIFTNYIEVTHVRGHVIVTRRVWKVVHTHARPVMYDLLETFVAHV